MIPHKRTCCTVFLLFATFIVLSTADAQTATTGAAFGVVVDSSGLPLSGASVGLATQTGSQIAASISDDKGIFSFVSILPGTYEIEARKPDFRSVAVRGIHVHVTETVTLHIRLDLAPVLERTEVLSNATLVRLETPAPGKTVTENAISNLPLVTRNFAQLAGLAPGVVTGVYNAGELGIGGTALSQISPSNDGLYVHGARSYDNNWLLDGISVSDVLDTGTASGGIPVPNPDAIQEFKVQTGLYDAAYGRAVGSNVSLITKTGTADYHGSIFEFFRNDVLNANDFFLNKTGQRRPTLKQNQFGFDFGGLLKRDRLAFFSSYQGTRQLNGVAAGQTRIACTASLREPPLSNQRSAAALGTLFGGQSGASGGVVVAADGSNINPVALALLNFKLPNGKYLIPTPQTIDASRPVASQGFSVFTEPCQFNEDQFLTNLDYTPSHKNHFATRLFVANDAQSVTFPGNGLDPAGNIPGFDSPGSSDFLVLSIAYTYVLSSTMLNELRLGIVRTQSATKADAPFAWSDIGVAEGAMNNNNQLPSLQILGSASMAPAFPRTYTQNSFVLSDTFSLSRGANLFQFGGSTTRVQAPLRFGGFNSYLAFLSWPDFLLGLNGMANGTGTFSNVFESADAYGLFDRDLEAWEAAGFAQDNYRATQRLTFNLGFRYERVGQFGDELGRASSFDTKLADSNPPTSGSLSGGIVGSSFPGTLPPGVIRVNNTAGTHGAGQNTFAPRLGFAWQVLPKTNRLALRAVYGIYYSRPTGQAFTASVLAAPFGLTRVSTGVANAAANFQAPFPQPFPTPASFPKFLPYSSTTQSFVNALSPNFRPATAQQFSLNSQAEVLKSWLLEVGYFGSRGTHLQRFRSLNQALDASPENPIRSLTSNTLANIPERVPIPGIRADGLRELESEGSSWYNGLEATLTKALNSELQFLASYTFSKTLDTDGANINGTSGVNALTLGDQDSPSQRWGRASFDRTHRFVFSTMWSLPSPGHGFSEAAMGGWSLAAIVTIQSGTALTIADTNPVNVFGISEDRAQLRGACSKTQYIERGPTQSKLDRYFNTACFTTPTVIGEDGIGTGFGNSATGMLDGPGQANLDIAVSKTISLKFLSEAGALHFRAEFYNAFNHPQFVNPDSNFTSPTFGVISSTAVNARVGQIALRYAF